MNKNKLFVILILALLLHGGSAFASTNVLETRVTSTGIATKNLTDSSTTQNIAHGLGTTPQTVRFTILNNGAAYTSGTFTNSTNRAIYTFIGSGNTVHTSTTSAVFIGSNSNSPSTTGQVGVVTVDSTNITITYTKNGSPTGTAQILWTAEAFTTTAIDEEDGLSHIRFQEEGSDIVTNPDVLNFVGSSITLTNSGATGILTASGGGGGGSGTFIGLTDVPAGFTGFGEQCVIVNNAEDALEFQECTMSYLDEQTFWELINSIGALFVLSFTFAVLLFAVWFFYHKARYQ